jgi:hypothetical protein
MYVCKFRFMATVYIRDKGFCHSVVEVFDFWDVARPVVVIYPVMFNFVASEWNCILLPNNNKHFPTLCICNCLGLNRGGGEIFRTSPDRPWGPPSLLYNGYRVFPGGKEWPGHDADPSPRLLVPWSWKSSAIPLLPLWAVRPVQSLSACTRVH